MLVVKNISFGYLNDKSVIQEMDLVIEKGKHVALLGESGCGKSTLLKLIYGLYDLNEGEIYWNDEPVLGPAYNLIPGVDAMRYLAQDFDLMPYTTVAENVGKFLSNINWEKKQNRIDELLHLVDMTNFADVKVKDLSGGQQQRVALARVLAQDPELLLLDEPFSHIDYTRKSMLRRELFSYMKEKGITCIVATHDSLDALSFADETVVLKDGNIVDAGETKELYEVPIDMYVASLFGEVNELYVSDFAPDTEADEVLLFYPHQLMISKQKGVLEVFVEESYFKGDGFMMKSLFKNNRTVYFNHPFAVEPGTIVKLAIKKYA
ncbi:MAG: ABC transporter ATP-binding protein [Flavobacteriaceae bacterium]|jgi:ABC-type Fe3+/spermidine/putrescine transport system ATPase subunit|nr:ABC transporter ATP-binding protein [Flavobacteriaceae bacterium]